jgi:hypothetical protein
MTIQVLVDIIDDETYQNICKFYNDNKDENELPLQILDRFEGGFKIDIPEKDWKKSPLGNFTDENDKIRQLRWRNRMLVSGGYKSFTGKQGMLLYEALIHSLPPGTVVII